MRNAFAHPWLLATLPALIALAVLAWRSRRVRRRLSAELGWEDSRRLVKKWPGFLAGLSTGLGLLLLGVGSAGPQWGWDWEQTAAPSRNVVVVLDRSRSMLAEKPTRLARARTALLDWTAHLRQRDNGVRLGLIVFAAKAKLVCPLTADYDHFREAVAAIDPGFTD